MSEFEIRQMMVPKNDGSNQKKQVFPQTSQSAVIGLPKWQETINSAIENITGKSIGKDEYDNIVHQKDLSNFATKGDVNNALDNATNYTNDCMSNIHFSNSGLNLIIGIYNFHVLWGQNVPYIAISSSDGLSNDADNGIFKGDHGVTVIGDKDYQIIYSGDKRYYRTSNAKDQYLQF